MSKYKVTIEIKQSDKVLRYKEVIINLDNGYYRPKIGECIKRLVDPPIYETVVKVVEVIEDYESHGNGD